MDWFFRQWVSFAAIPTVLWNAEPDRTASTRCSSARGRRRPRLCDARAAAHQFASGRAIVRVAARGPVTDASLTEKPTRVGQSPESVLAEVETEPWRRDAACSGRRRE
jgi:hypothetical protein